MTTRIFLVRAGIVGVLIPTVLSLLLAVLWRRNPDLGKSEIRLIPLQIQPRPLADAAKGSVRWHCAELMRPLGEIEEISVLLHYLDFWVSYERRFGATKTESDRLLCRLLSCPGANPSNSQRALFYMGQDGVLRSRSGASNGGEAHLGQTLAVLGKLGLSSESPLRTESGSCTIREALRGLQDTFSLSGDSDWPITAFAYYLPPSTSWSNRWGRRFTFSEVARALLGRTIGEGTCFGTHTLNLLALLLNSDSIHAILEPAVAAEIHSRLLKVSSILQTTQHSDGGWGEDWWEPDGPGKPTTIRQHSHSTLHITGHHLEWFAICDSHCCPSSSCIHRAISYCRRAISSTTSKNVAQSICNHEHAFLAIVLCEAEKLD